MVRRSIALPLFGAAVCITAAVLTLGCAGGKPTANGRDGSTGNEQGLPWLDAYVWPDQYVYRDGPQPQPDLAADSGVVSSDLGVDQALPPDLGKPDSAPISCPDIHEPNQICAAAKYLGSIGEGSSFNTNAATLDPGSDVDWYRADGKEDSHTCLPFTNQTYYFKVRLTVPAGRELRICLYKDACGGAATCLNNAGNPGPTQLEVKYKVSGTCAFNDDTTGYFKVDAMDGKGGCTTYSVGFNYN